MRFAGAAIGVIATTVVAIGAVIAGSTKGFVVVVVIGAVAVLGWLRATKGRS